jgi:hypothetical protein
MMVVVLPWSYRNDTVFHHFVLISTNGGQTFLGGNADPWTPGRVAADNPLVALGPICELCR